MDTFHGHRKLVVDAEALCCLRDNYANEHGVDMPYEALQEMYEKALGLKAGACAGCAAHCTHTQRVHSSFLNSHMCAFSIARARACHVYAMRFAVCHPLCGCARRKNREIFHAALRESNELM